MSGALTKIIELVDSRVRVTTFYPLCITSYHQAANVYGNNASVPAAKPTHYPIRLPAPLSPTGATLRENKNWGRDGRHVMRGSGCFSMDGQLFFLNSSPGTVSLRPSLFMRTLLRYVHFVSSAVCLSSVTLLHATRRLNFSSILLHHQ